MSVTDDDVCVCVCLFVCCVCAEHRYCLCKPMPRKKSRCNIGALRYLSKPTPCMCIIGTVRISSQQHTFIFPNSIPLRIRPSSHFRWMLLLVHAPLLFESRSVAFDLFSGPYLSLSRSPREPHSLTQSLSVSLGEIFLSVLLSLLWGFSIFLFLGRVDRLHLPI